MTVTGTNLAGKPDTGDDVFVVNVDNSLLTDINEATSAFYHGVAKYSVPAGHYFAVGIFGPAGPAGPAPVRLTVLPQFTVSANTTVHIAERAADSAVTMVTPRPARAMADNFYLARQPAKGGQIQLQFVTTNSSIWVSPAHRPTTVGWVRSYTSAELTSPPGPGVPYAYALSFIGPRGIVPPQRYVVRPAKLATVTEAYYQDVASPGYWAVFGSLPNTFNGYVEPDIFSGSLPGTRVLYLGGNPTATWASYYAGQGAGNGNGQDEFFRSLRPGQQLTDTWNRYPLHPAADTVLAPKNHLTIFLPSADRAGDKLTLEVTPFGDNQPGHFSFGFSKVPHATITGSYRIAEDGHRIAGGSALGPGRRGPFYTRVTLRPQPSTVSFTLNAARTGAAFGLSTASHTVWTWRSAHEAGHTVPLSWYCFNPPPGFTKGTPRHCAAEPMMTLNYNVAGESLGGSAPPGRQVLTVTAGHIQLVRAIPVTGANVQVSFDDGTTWHRARVTRMGPGRFRAVFTAPAGAYVTLRTTAHDAAGGSISETITRGYQTGS